MSAPPQDPPEPDGRTGGHREHARSSNDEDTPLRRPLSDVVHGLRDAVADPRRGVHAVGELLDGGSELGSGPRDFIPDLA